MMTEEQLDFILIRQKDIILKLIQNKQLDRARSCLTVVKELWEVCEYEYKYKELHQKIIEAKT